MLHHNNEAPINIGWGIDVSIAELDELVGRVMGFTGGRRFEPAKPDGTRASSWIHGASAR